MPSFPRLPLAAFQLPACSDHLPLNFTTADNHAVHRSGGSAFSDG
ncbi:hypothetical protein RSSM_01805 [Rhodopirellula sallentina SM41]|uniref:Uncharacterized protein n=1 Tax=Rhodopirellula sallentina SM41 TaxID=1263870 RepID=M5U5P7_9BACT|nr:hypothetical protein RSSM_01805 [Rhodopirellula sallentina SM41]